MELLPSLKSQCLLSVCYTLCAVFWLFIYQFYVSTRLLRTIWGQSSSPFNPSRCWVLWSQTSIKCTPSPWGACNLVREMVLPIKPLVFLPQTVEEPRISVPVQFLPRPQLQDKANWICEDCFSLHITLCLLLFHSSCWSQKLSRGTAHLGEEVGKAKWLMW